jgi:membrane protein DedA with SNARE-associated domain
MLVADFIQFLDSTLFAIQSGRLPQFGNWTYFLLVLLVILEGPSATLLGAAAASAGLMKPSLVFLAATVGNLTADSLWYSIGYFGNSEWFFRFQRFGRRRKLIEYLKQNMTNHVTKILLLAKFSLSFMIPTLITAGLLRIPWRRWFPTLILADTLWTGLLVVIGYYSLESIRGVKQGIEYAVLFASILLVTAIFVLGHRLKKQWDQADADPDTDSEQL